MNHNKPEIILIVGVQRSGTSLLTAMLGAHPEINAFWECFDTCFLKGYGKKYNLNKLILHRQIRMYERANKFKHVINRLSKLINDLVPIYFPISKLSVKDYIDMGAKIIIVKREKENNINSIINRVKYTRKQAEKEYNKSMKIIEQIKKCAKAKYHIITFNKNKPYSKTQLLSLLRFLNIEFHENMLNGYKYNWLYLEEQNKNSKEGKRK